MTNARDLLNDSTDRLAAFQALMAERKAEVKAKAKVKAKTKAKAPYQPPVIPWSERALTFIAAMPPKKCFNSNDVILGVGEPPDRKGIGGLFYMAWKNGLVEDTGMSVPSDSPKARGRRIRVWERSEKKRP